MVMKCGCGPSELLEMSGAQYVTAMTPHVLPEGVWFAITEAFRAKTELE